MFVQPLLQWKNKEYYICVFVTLGIYHAMCMGHIVICSLSGLNIFFNIIPKMEDFRKQKYWTQNVFWFSLQLLSETFLILTGTERDRSKMHIGLRVKYQLYLSHMNETYVFLTEFSQISWKSIQWEQSCSRRTDEQTDMTKLIIFFF